MNTRTTAILALGALFGGCQEYTIEGFGEATAAPNPPSLVTEKWVDRVKQGVQPKVDILWILDNSCSMSEEQDNIATNLGEFFKHIDDAGVDWHMGVVTTDIDSSSTDDASSLEVAAGYRLITDNTPFREELFEALVRVGTSGSGEERGLYTGFHALAKTNPVLQETNRGINRPNAAMHVIVVSDENDQSSTRPSSAPTPWNGITPNEMSNFLKTTKSDPDIPVTFSSIVGGPGGCRGPGGDADHGERYIDVTNQVGGLFFSICEEEWDGILDALGALASGIRQEFWLSKVPVPKSVRVKVTDWDGVWRGFEERTDPADLPDICNDDEAPFCFAFRYDEYRNSLNFVDYTPSDLAQIEIIYNPLDSYVGEEPIGDW